MPSPPCDLDFDAPIPVATDMSRARDEIRHQFSVEILLKHDELRLINQELAKCQVALEQLRRCHLIPYPVSCPTPEQMLQTSDGKGPALVAHPGDAVPQWAPPFGVVDGPYARHYAKWLIPDPAFDGVQPGGHHHENSRARTAFAEGRTTRNSCSDSGAAAKGRAGRGNASHKLQALSNGYPQPRDKSGPCVLKRSDGQTVKLVCLDCHRENFSSTQGFINHCRIAHKRDFKSHEEAAVHCGQAIEVAAENSGCVVKDDKAPTTPSIPTSVHPFARKDMSEQEAYAALRSRLADSLKLYHQGKLPGVSHIPSTARLNAPVGRSSGNASQFGPAPETPYLSLLLQNRKFGDNLVDIVTDAKTKVSLEDITPDDDPEDIECTPSPFNGIKDTPPARTPVVMRLPTKSTTSPGSLGSSARPPSSKGRAAHMTFISPPVSAVDTASKHGVGGLSDEDLDMDDANLSPTTLISHNAPSLVSDDGEYDDSDEGSSVSGASDHLETESVSDVAEITLDDDHDPRALRRGSSGVPGSMRLRKEENKHVTFISSVKSSTTERRTRKV